MSPRHTIPFLIAALVALAWTGCRRDVTDTAGERVVVTYWEKWSGFEADAVREVIRDFNASQDRIEVQYLSVSQIDVKLLLAASSGNPPDVAGLWSHTVPDFAEKGALTPLDEAIAGAGLTPEHYVPIFWELCRHRGFTWGMPTTPGCVALFYNKRLYRAAGLDPERPPRTLEELEAASQRLTVVELERQGKRLRVSFDTLTEKERAARHYRILQIGHLPQDAGMFRSAWGCWFGAELYDGERRILADAPENRAALQWLHDTAATYGVDNLRSFGASFGVSQSAQTPFLGGAAAMVLQGPWMKNFIEKYSPGLEWGVAPFPAAPGVAGGAPVTLVECDVAVIPRGAKHPREAMEFIAYLQRQDVAEKLATAQQKFTALRDVSPAFLRNHPNTAISLFIDLARGPGARSVPRLSIWREYDAEMSVAIDRVLNLRAEPAVALEEVQERVQWRLDRVMRRWDAVADERLKEWRVHEIR